MLTATRSFSPYAAIKPLYGLEKTHCKPYRFMPMKSPPLHFINANFNAEFIDDLCTNDALSCLPTLTELLYDYEKSDYEKSDHKKNVSAPLEKTSEQPITFNKSINLSQQQIIEQFKKHIAAKNRSPDPRLEERGYCLGLTSVWLLRMLRNEGAQFHNELTSIAMLTQKEIENLPDRIDTPIECLFNLLQWTQQSGKLLKIPQINPLEQDPTFNSILSLTLTGTPSWCANLLYASECLELDGASLTPKNTLILLRFFGHAAAIYRNEDNLWFYDPNCKKGSTIVQSRIDLSDMLWKANGGGKHVTFSIDLYRDQSQPTPLADDLATADHLATTHFLAKLMAEEMEFSGFLHASDVNGCTALLNAAKQGHREAVKAFLNFGVDINKESHQGVTPLLIAAIKNHIEIVKDLIDHGADLNKTDQNGATPLWVAAQNGYIEIVQALVDAGADVHIVDNQGVSALLAAEQSGYSAVVNTLRTAKSPI